jgi:hypothetical protein
LRKFDSVKHDLRDLEKVKDQNGGLKNLEKIRGSFLNYEIWSERLDRKIGMKREGNVGHGPIDIKIKKRNFDRHVKFSFYDVRICQQCM